MIINIKKDNLPKTLDTGKTIVTDPRCIKEYIDLCNKKELTPTENRRKNRIKKYGDKAYGKHKMAGFENHPTEVKSLAEIAEKSKDSDYNIIPIIEEIEDGMNPIEACEKYDIKPRYFYKILEKPENEEYKVRYLNARITLAEYYMYRRERLEKDLLEGKIDTPTYSALSSDYKYLAGKLAPLAYGDKIQFEANVKKSNTFEVINSDKVKELNQLLTSNIIDAEFEEE